MRSIAVFRYASRRAVFVATALALLFSLNCTPPRLLDDSIVYGGTYDERERVRDAVRWLEAPVQHAVRSIHITDYCPNYLPMDEDGNPREGGHCEWSRDICIRPACTRDALVWHECGHAFLISRSAVEWRQWADISKDAYGNTEGEFPREGILTAYGAMNAHEDFAEWVRWAMCYLYDTPTGQMLADERVADASDRRYLQHLQVLRDWGAISQAQYDRLEPLFTVRLDGVPMK